ncbi:MAG: glycosyltransferase [Bacteroidia bacterium]|nr:glycosyltransferase [Bacteroidia bacterium]
MKEKLLSVVTITYNHEPFIAKTIEGVLMQQVNFPIELIIAEDCSTDGTRAICQRYAEQYPDLIRLITSESNVGAVANERRAILAARGKYIAFCEGDDYWTDPLKLQKQVDFLELHPEYSVTFHRCTHINVLTNEHKEDNCEHLFLDTNTKGIDVTIPMFFQSWITQPLTMVFRKDSFDPTLYFQYQYYRDMHQIYHLLLAGKGYLFAFNGGVRLMHQGGMASLLNENKQRLNGINIAKELYILNKSVETKNYYQDMLQWYIYGVPSVAKSLQASFVLFSLNKKLLQLIRNIKRIVKICFQ